MTPNQYPPAPTAGGHILPFVARPLPSAASDMQVPPGGLLYLSSLLHAGAAESLTAGLSLTERSPTIAHTPMDAIRWTQDKALEMDAVFAAFQGGGSSIPALFVLFKNEDSYVNGRVSKTHPQPHSERCHNSPRRSM